MFVEGDGAGSDKDFAETLQRTLGDLARSTQDIQVCRPIMIQLNVTF